MNSDVNTYISPDIQESIRRDIEQARGNEIFFVGITDECRKVIDITPLARGNRSQVAASGELA